MKTGLTLFLSFLSCFLLAQFPGPAGTIGTTAMYADSSAFIAWGKQCIVSKGYQDISNTSLGFVNVGDSSNALGKADASIVSLGDGGVAIITFTTPITNGSGYDFAVFENSFNDSFLELAFVEVSSDGINFYRFPATSNSQNILQYDNAAVMDAAKLNNLAGKYRGQYGTPFDLEEMTGIPQLNINAITHVKIIDVVGSINPSYATYDKNNTLINDPWPTPFGSSGFDLDAVGVINQAAVGINELDQKVSFTVYPNPAHEQFRIFGSDIENKITVKVVNVIGEEIIHSHTEGMDQQFDISNLSPGIYLVQVETTKGKATFKLIKE